MSITRTLCGVRPLCRVSMFEKMAASWCLIQITPEHTRTLKFKANTNMSLSHVDTGAAYAYLPMTRSTLVSFYCALKKQVLRFTSVYLMRAGYLFAFLFYPRKDRPLQYQDVSYCLRSTARYLHSLPKSKRALFYFPSEKKQHIYILYRILLCFLIKKIFLNNLFKNFYGRKSKYLTNFYRKAFLLLQLLSKRFPQTRESKMGTAPYLRTRFFGYIKFLMHVLQ